MAEESRGDRRGLHPGTRFKTRRQNGPGTSESPSRRSCPCRGNEGRSRGPRGRAHGAERPPARSAGRSGDPSPHGAMPRSGGARRCATFASGSHQFRTAVLRPRKGSHRLLDDALQLNSRSRPSLRAFSASTPSSASRSRPAPPVSSPGACPSSASCSVPPARTRLLPSLGLSPSAAPVGRWCPLRGGLPPRARQRAQGPLKGIDIAAHLLEQRLHFGSLGRHALDDDLTDPVCDVLHGRAAYVRAHVVSIDRHALPAGASLIRAVQAKSATPRTGPSAQPSPMPGGLASRTHADPQRCNPSPAFLHASECSALVRLPVPPRWLGFHPRFRTGFRETCGARPKTFRHGVCLRSSHRALSIPVAPPLYARFIPAGGHGQLDRGSSSHQDSEMFSDQRHGSPEGAGKGRKGQVEVNWTAIGTIVSVLALILGVVEYYDRAEKAGEERDTRATTENMNGPEDTASLGETGFPRGTVSAARQEEGRPAQGEVVKEYTTGVHPAIHIRAQEDGRVHATAKGRIISVKHLTRPAGQTPGWEIVIEHGPGAATTYQGLERPGVRVDQRVERGEVIGQIATGQGSDGELHYGVRLEGIFTDPDSVTAAVLEAGVPECGLRGEFRLERSVREEGINIVVLDGTGRPNTFNTAAGLIENALCASDGSRRMYEWESKSLLPETHIIWQDARHRRTAEQLAASISGPQEVYRYGERARGGYGWFGFEPQRQLIIFVGNDWNMVVAGLVRGPEEVLYGRTRTRR